MTAPAQTPAELLRLSALLRSDNRISAEAVEMVEEGREWFVDRRQDRAVWDCLLAMAEAHGMRPLLYRFLSSAEGNVGRTLVCPQPGQTKVRPTFPDYVTAMLREFTQQNLKKNLRMSGELIHLLRLFAGQGVDVIPFKGPTLAALAYGDLGLREFGDLDLLIAKPDFMKAQELLIARGYQPEILLNARQAAAFAEACNVMAFWHAEKEISVEAHWGLSPKYLPFSPDFERLRRRMVPSHPGGQTVMTLSPEDLLVYLCAHGAKHAWERLIWIADVGALIHGHSNLDWGGVHDLAVEQRCERVLSLGLRLARDVAGVALPARMEEFVRSDAESEKLAAKVTYRLFLDPDSSRGLGPQTLFIFKCQRRWADKIRSFARLMTTSSSADWISFPSLRRFPGLYPLLRPLRLMIKMVRGAR